MIRRDILDLLQCPACAGPELTLGSGRRPDLVCGSCDAHYPIVNGIPDLVAPEATPAPGTYRTETLANVIAGVYDVVAPVMSMAIWRCSPLRYIDHENRALGRARGGVYLEAPIGTGVALAPCIAPYHDVTVLGVDKSWKMLFQAQKRLKKTGASFQLIRADVNALPIKSGAVRSLQSLNGLHSFTDRVGALREFHRCLEPEGYVSGSTLVRAQTDMADAVLERYERYGIYPMLRSPEFLLQEVGAASFEGMHFETHGAVMFFAGQRATRNESETTSPSTQQASKKGASKKGGAKTSRSTKTSKGKGAAKSSRRAG